MRRHWASSESMPEGCGGPCNGSTPGGEVSVPGAPKDALVRRRERLLLVRLGWRCRARLDHDRDDHDRAADEGERGGPLVEREPYPQRAEHHLEQSDEAHLRRRYQPRPTVSSAKPSPICPMPSAASHARSPPPISPGLAKGRKTATRITCDRQVAGAMETSWRQRVITIMIAKASAARKESPSPARLPSPGAPSMSVTPARASAIARTVRRVIGSTTVTRASSAAPAKAARPNTWVEAPRVSWR